MKTSKIFSFLSAISFGTAGSVRIADMVLNAESFSNSFQTYSRIAEIIIFFGLLAFMVINKRNIGLVIFSGINLSVSMFYFYYIMIWPSGSLFPIADMITGFIYRFGFTFPLLLDLIAAALFFAAMLIFNVKSLKKHEDKLKFIALIPGILYALGDVIYLSNFGIFYNSTSVLKILGVLFAGIWITSTLRKKEEI